MVHFGSREEKIEGSKILRWSRSVFGWKEITAKVRLPIRRYYLPPTWVIDSMSLTWWLVVCTLESSESRESEVLIGAERVSDLRSCQDW